jgi:putative ABC transport system permease protein
VKFLPLLLANLKRKKIRTALTIGSFAVALFIFGLLVAVRDAFNTGVDMAGADRLVITNRTSIIQPLPISYRDQLLKIPGVAAVSHANWFGGVYQDQRNFFPQFAVDVDTWPEMYREFLLTDEELAAFRSNRRAAIAGEGLAERFGWKVGDRIPIKGAIFPGDWQFDLVGIYRASRPRDDVTQFWFRYDYLKENGPEWVDGIVGWYVVRLEDPEVGLLVGETIDERFANSAWETRTQTEKAMNAAFVKQMGNIELLILVIGSVVVFTLLLVTGNTMAAAVRERVSEHAVLKALGYSDRGVLWLVLAEAGLIAAVGGAIGLTAAKLFSRQDPTGGFFPSFFISPEALATGFAVAVGVGLMAGLLPALEAMRLSVIDAMRRA